MIRLLIFFARRSNKFNEWIKNFISIYRINFPVIEAPINSQAFIAESCKKDLERVMTYEKLGSKSGLPKPRIIAQPK